MSITFEIVKFKKPTKDDLSNLHMFNPYGSIPILDDDGDSTGWNIYMFRADDKGIQNIINSCYAVKMELQECITDYDSFFEDLGFPKEAVSNGVEGYSQRKINKTHGKFCRELRELILRDVPMEEWIPLLQSRVDPENEVDKFNRTGLKYIPSENT